MKKSIFIFLCVSFLTVNGAEELSKLSPLTLTKEVEYGPSLESDESYLIQQIDRLNQIKVTAQNKLRKLNKHPLDDQYIALLNTINRADERIKQYKKAIDKKEFNKLDQLRKEPLEKLEGNLKIFKSWLVKYEKDMIAFKNREACCSTKVWGVKKPANGNFQTENEVKIHIEDLTRTIRRYNSVIIEKKHRLA